MTTTWTPEELMVDEIRATLVETGQPIPWGDGSPDFGTMTQAVWNDLFEQATDGRPSARDVRKVIVQGYDATLDSQGPNYEVMAQRVYDRFLKSPAPTCSDLGCNRVTVSVVGREFVQHVEGCPRGAGRGWEEL